MKIKGGYHLCMGALLLIINNYIEKIKPIFIGLIIIVLHISLPETFHTKNVA